MATGSPKEDSLQLSPNLNAPIPMPITAVVVDDEQLAREELKFLLNSADGVEILAEGSNGIEAVELIEEHQPDVVFLDVQMPGLDGFAVLKQLIEHRGVQRLPQIVFATAYDQYAVRAFEVNAGDYVLKPFDRSRILQAVERVRARQMESGPDGAAAGTASGAGSGEGISTLLEMLHRQQASQRSSGPSRLPNKLIVQVQSRLLLVDQAEICYAAIDEGVIRVVTRAFEGQSKCRTLEELMELLDPARFWRAHRGFVVNIDQIREVMPWFKSSYQLRMNDRQQTEIPVSRAQTKRLRELFNL
jgi:two-component system, LytTR family, response regulator LytT